mmetsp:Transcript_61470/g.178241  ORF Transcript_61470/g.178241 Transcript_61470/m.178241 type:complete len:283 (-) Transcript_61470:46-894(-)
MSTMPKISSLAFASRSIAWSPRALSSAMALVNNSGAEGSLPRLGSFEVTLSCAASVATVHAAATSSSRASKAQSAAHSSSASGALLRIAPSNAAAWSKVAARLRGSLAAIAAPNGAPGGANSGDIPILDSSTSCALCRFDADPSAAAPWPSTARMGAVRRLGGRHDGGAGAPLWRTHTTPRPGFRSKTQPRPSWSNKYSTPRAPSRSSATLKASPALITSPVQGAPIRGSSRISRPVSKSQRHNGSAAASCSVHESIGAVLADPTCIAAPSRWYRRRPRPND